VHSSLYFGLDAEALARRCARLRSAGPQKVLGWESWKTLVAVWAYGRPNRGCGQTSNGPLWVIRVVVGMPGVGEDRKLSRTMIYGRLTVQARRDQPSGLLSQGHFSVRVGERSTVECGS
jgi:hypothetical protein